jgi:hypothetical protein
MNLYIEKEGNIENIKKVFSTCYPFLKIEFYKKQYLSDQPLARKEVMSPKATLLQSLLPAKSVINIGNERTVTQIENDFASLGLIAEVFRKSGNVWVGTSLTNDWTLQQQNLEGEEISRHFQKECFCGSMFNKAAPEVYLHLK